jgi:hypothetical protein
MAVMAREAWTDERLDDLKGHVDKRFDQVDRRFERVDAEFKELRGEINSRFDSMQRTMIIGFVGLFASIAGSVIGVVLTSQL